MNIWINYIHTKRSCDFQLLVQNSLFFVISATSGAGLLFQAGVQFSTGIARETVLSEVYLENVKAFPDIALGRYVNQSYWFRWFLM